MHAPPLLATSPLAPRLGVVLRALAALVASRFLRDPRRVVYIVPLWRLLTRAATRLETLFARLAAGPLPPPRPRPPHPGGPRRKPAFPTTRAWLIRALGAEAAACASQLQSLLAEPEAALLLANPAARRTLAPIRRMLGLTDPRPRPRRTPVVRRSPPPLPPHRSLDPHPPRPWWLPPPHLRSG